MHKVIGPSILSKRTKHGVIGPRILRDSINSELGSFPVWKWSSYVQVAFGKMADSGNEKKTAVSQDWRHKKEKPSYQSFPTGNTLHVACMLQASNMRF